MPEKVQTVIAALYQFKEIADCATTKALLKKFCQDHQIKGTLILATEGINGTVSGNRENISTLKNLLTQSLGFDKLEYKESLFNHQPFYRMKVLIKKEIVTLGRPDIQPHQRTGTYVSPTQWNKLIASHDVTLIDARNDYETQIGSFKNALDPKTKHFRQFSDFVKNNLDPQKNSKIALFCTGGIRCEKASALMLAMGFPEVYHLKGGILKYLEEVPPEESLWEGECFVFDQRVSVGHEVQPGQYELCFGCRYPLSPRDKTSKHYQEGICCPHCYPFLTPEKQARFSERHRQMTLAKEKGKIHLGAHFSSTKTK